MENKLLHIGYYQEAIPLETGIPDFSISPGALSRSSDDLSPGDYLGGAIQGTFTLDYSSFDQWRKQLSLSALGFEAERIWSSPDAFAGEPFYEIIHCERETVFGPLTSLKLAEDFRTMEHEVERNLFARSDGAELQFFTDVYQLFKKAFQVASHSGCTIFS